MSELDEPRGITFDLVWREDGELLIEQGHRFIFLSKEEANLLLEILQNDLGDKPC